MMINFIKNLFLTFGMIPLFLSVCFADIMPPNSHNVSRCVKIVENKELKNITLWSNITGPMVDGFEKQEIEYNTCLSKGYKFNTFEVLLKSSGSDLSLGGIATRGGFVSNSNPLVSENITYQVVQKDNTYMLKQIAYEKGFQSLYKNVSFLVSLILTIILETIMLFVLSKNTKLAANNKTILFTGIVCSLLTLPIFWMLRGIGSQFLDSFEVYVLVGEILIFIVEAFIMKFILKTSFLKSLTFSFVCNLLSYLCGLFFLEMFVNEICNFFIC